MFQDLKQIILIFFFVVCGVYLLRLLYLQVIDEKYLTVGSTAFKRELQVLLCRQKKEAPKAVKVDLINPEEKLIALKNKK